MTRRLAGILAADVVGYSAMVGTDEPRTLARVRALRAEIVEPLAAAHEGRVFKTTGDGFLAAFASAVQALRCAIAIQDALRAQDDGLRLRIGVHQGEVMPEGDDLLGDGVIVAARLEPLAEPDGICISGRVHEDATGKIALDVEDIGTPELKNIVQSVRVYRVRLNAPERPTLALPEKPSLAVLPFQNMSGDPEQEYFADGVVEDITTALSRTSWLFVIARNSSFTYKGRSVDIKQVGRELGVRYVLEGSMRRAGGRVRITCQLIEAATGGHVWADRFEGDLADIFDLQDRITESVIGAIVPNLERAEMARAQAKPTSSLDAFDLFLRALALYETFSRDDADVAIPMLRRAIAIDSGFIRAKALLALWLTNAASNGWAPPGGHEEGVAMARAVVATHCDDADALASAAFALIFLAYDHAAARAAATRALALNPNSMRVLYFAGRVLAAAGELDDAHSCYARALRISPIDPRRGRIMVGIAEAHLAAGHFEDAIAAAVGGLREQPHYLSLLRAYIAGLVALGRVDEAKVQASLLMEYHPRFRISQRDYVRQYRDTSVATPLLDGMRAVGIPE